MTFNYITYCISILLIILTCNVDGNCHETRPAYLRITEVNPNSYEAVWKIPANQNRIINLIPLLDDQNNWQLMDETLNSNSLTRYYSFVTEESINGKELSIQNMGKTLIDALIQIDLNDKTSYTFMLTPSDSEIIIPSEESYTQMIRTYFILGVEHILLGFDHLLFVLGLFLIIPSWRMLLKTITAFTLAHSITLILASLGMIDIPISPVEAVIALSIVLLAREIISYHRGESSLIIRRPWIVAFIFGLIHGLGFAGALNEIGLPQKSIPTALVIFNIGVEIGQIVFLICISIIIQFIRKTSIQSIIETKVLPYAIGSLGAFWLIERVAAF